LRIDELPVPDSVKAVLAKAGYDSLYPPQEDAIKAGVLEGKNLVLASPTASGKTLVAELAALKSVLERDGKVLYLTPLRALASEKFEDFQKYTTVETATGRKVRVAITSGDYDSSDLYLANYDIVISTNEKADSLLRHRSPWISDVTVVVADEIHLITEADRGPTLEVVLTRLLKINPRLQVIALSATIKNAKEIGEWLEAEPITTEWRPVPLREGVYYGGQIQFKDGSSRIIPQTDSNPVFDTALEVIRDGGQVLIFTETRRLAVEMSKKAGALLRRTVPKPDRRSLENIAQRILSTGERTRLGEALAEQVLNGVGFHHAGLPGAHRRIIEDAFRSARLKILSATPTLCLHPDTLITTSRGPVRIADIRKGDTVLTHTGTMREVLGTSVRRFQGELIEVKAAGMLPIRMTEQHRVLANIVKREGYHRGKVSVHWFTRSEPGWKRAVELQVGNEVQTPIEVPTTATNGGTLLVLIHEKEFVGRNQFGSEFPHPGARPVPLRIELDAILGEFFGLYAAEGFTGRNGLVAFGVATYENELTRFLSEVLSTRFMLNPKVTDEDRHRRRVWACSRTLATFLDNEFGHGAVNKHLPESFLSSPPRILTALVRGLWRGDGTYSTKYFNTARFSTVSPRLAEQVVRMLKRLGYLPSIKHVPPRGIGKNWQYQLALSGAQGARFIVAVLEVSPRKLRRGNRTYNTRIRLDQTFRSPIRELRHAPYSGPVYNLQVEGDESYVCSFGFSVHNSAGVNLPARTVIISSYERYEAGYGRYPISVLEYKQFCGRAGRPRYDKFGEAVLIARTEDEQDYLLKNYALAEPERIWSKLGAEKVLRPHVLATVATRFATTEDGLERFFARTFYAFQYDPKMIKGKLGDILAFLNREQMVELEGEELKATKFGRRVSELYIDPVSAVVLRDGLYTRAKHVTDISLLHLISRTPDISPKLYPRRGEDEMLDLFAKEHQDEYMCEVPEYYGDTNGIGYEEFLAEIKCTRVLYEWINETSEDGILKVHRVEPGDILRMVDTAKWLLHATYRLAELFGHKDLLNRTYELQVRCAKGVKSELVPLVELDSVGRVRARSLFNAGFKNLDDLRRASVTDLMNVPTIGPSVAKKIKEQVGGLIKAEEWEALRSKTAESTEQSLLTDYKEPTEP
jgi:helicase